MEYFKRAYPKKCLLCGAPTPIEFSYCVGCRNLRQGEIAKNEKKCREWGFRF